MCPNIRASKGKLEKILNRIKETPRDLSVNDRAAYVKHCEKNNAPQTENGAVQSDGLIDSRRSGEE